MSRDASGKLAGDDDLLLVAAGERAPPGVHGLGARMSKSRSAFVGDPCRSSASRRAPPRE